MADPNFYRGASFDSLRWSGVAVTPSDGADLAKLAATITAAVAGNIQVTCSGGGTVILGITAGANLPVLVDRVWATNTTATGIVALYGQ
jgi:hypothetical protein